MYTLLSSTLLGFSEARYKFKIRISYDNSYQWRYL